MVQEDQCKQSPLHQAALCTRACRKTCFEVPYAGLQPVGGHCHRAWTSPCPVSARHGAVGQAGTPFQTGVFLSQGGPILASVQETCLCSHSMQACSKATSLSWPRIMQSRPGGSRAMSMMRIFTCPCSPTAHACSQSLLLAYAIQQSWYHAAAKCCTCIDRHSYPESKHRGFASCCRQRSKIVPSIWQLVCKPSCLGDDCLSCFSIIPLLTLAVQPHGTCLLLGGPKGLG